MGHLTFLPIHLDALFLRAEQSVVEATADFSRLPFYDQDAGRDINSNTPFISEAVISEPFQDNDLRLKPGIHLHWALPDTLTKSIGFRILKKGELSAAFPKADILWQELLDKNWIKLIHSKVASILPAEQRKGRLSSNLHQLENPLEQFLSKPLGSEFPPVPNRWLISRSVADRLEKQWIVESDFLYPAGKGSNSGGISYPFPADWSGKPGQAFRFLGRKLPLEVWLNQPDLRQGSYLDDIDNHYLTAIGYGEPTFAAFYPNCHSLFGLHDDDYKQSYPTDLQYEVVGWYATEENDFLQIYLKDFENKYTGKPEELTNAMWAALQQDLSWTVDAAQQIVRPGPLVCFAQITFNPEPVATLTAENPAPKSQTHITVGNTPTEALSAYLAKEIAPRHKTLVEDQLESLLLSAQLDHRKLDLGAKFFEARHQKAFNAFSGGIKWTIKSEIADSGAGAQAGEKTPLNLPESLARHLNQLNTLQSAYNQISEVIISMRRQLYSDWYKYQLCAYPPEDSLDRYPDIDLVRYFMQEKGLASLQQKEKISGQLVVQRNELGNPIAAIALDNEPGSLAKQLEGAIQAMLTAISTFNNLDSTQQSKQQVRLTTEAGPRYWQAKEPVVLVTGDQVQATHRHGQDGRGHPEGWLSAHLLQVADNGPSGNHLFRMELDNIRTFIQSLKEASNNDPTGFYQWSGNPWHPLLLEWEVEVFPKKKGLNLKVAEGSYAPDYITGNYTLPLNQPDLEGAVSEDSVIRSAQVYRGRSILTPQAGIQVNKNLEAYFERTLKEEILRDFYKAGDIPMENRNDTWLNEHFLEFASWAQAKNHTWQQLPVGVDPQTSSPIDLWISLNTAPLAEWFLSENFILQQFVQAQQNGAATGDLDGFIAWMLDRSELKKLFFAAQNISQDQQENYLANNPDKFLTWFRTIQPDFSLYFWENQVSTDNRNDAYVEEHLEEVIAWYQAELRIAYQLRILIGTYHWLDGLNTLSQSLGGFNDALLMHKRTLQLAVEDPLGFQESQDFAEVVKQAVGPFQDIAPQPGNDFSPIRNGLMKIQQLRLIDTFGQSRNLIEMGNFLYGPSIRTSEPLDGPDNKLMLALPPRLMQACKLNFRWLSARDGAQEMNDHPATSPIFGWILANHLDQSLMIYDENGLALGEIGLNRNFIWSPAPGHDFSTTPSAIANPHLRRVVQYLIDRQEESLATGTAPDSSFLWHYISLLDNAMEYIDPESFGRHQDLAILMGRPLALARVRLGFELMGNPAIHQGWNAFRQDLKHHDRITDGFERVKFPIRLGEYRQFNDGLVGYWLEDGTAFRGPLFYAPQSTAIDDPNIRSHANDPLQILQAVADADQYLTLLLDPRGKVHATSGILPVKEISLPPEQYASALSNIDVTFLTAPLLSSQQGINLTLPNEPGFTWSWLERTPNQSWKTVSNVETIDRTTFLETLSAPSAQTIWQLLLTDDIQWLQAFPGKEDLAIIVPKEQRKAVSLPNAAWDEQIQQIFDYYGTGIKAFENQAVFTGRQQIKEGWLKLQAAAKTIDPS